MASPGGSGAKTTPTPVDSRRVHAVAGVDRLPLGRRSASVAAPVERVAWAIDRATTVWLTVLSAIFVLALAPLLVGMRVVVVDGGSMRPTMPGGTLALTRATAPDRIEVGDVVVVRDAIDGKLSVPRVHRVVEIETAEDGRRLARTKGDGNVTVDARPAPLVAEVPKVVTHVAFVGVVVEAMRRPAGWFVLLVLPLALARVAQRCVRSGFVDPPPVTSGS